MSAETRFTLALDSSATVPKRQAGKPPPDEEDAVPKSENQNNQRGERPSVKSRSYHWKRYRGMTAVISRRPRYLAPFGV
jgi:hypothetical protein